MPVGPPKGFRDIPKDVREWSRFFTLLPVSPDDFTVTPGTIAENAIETDKILDSAVTLAKLQSIAADRLLGKLTTAGSPEELTAAQVATLLQAVAWTFAAAVQFNGNVGFYGTTPISQPANIADAETAHALNAVFSDTEVEAALDALGTKINSILTALESLGLTA